MLLASSKYIPFMEKKKKITDCPIWETYCMESEMGNIGNRSGIRHNRPTFLRICAVKISLFRKGFFSLFFIILYQKF